MMTAGPEDGGASAEPETTPEVEAGTEVEAKADDEPTSASSPSELESGILEMAGEPASEDEVSEPEVDLGSALEAILFAAAEPIPLQRLSRLFQGQGRGAVKKALTALQEELAEGSRGIRLVEVSSGYQFRSAPEHAPWLRRFFAEKPPRLSRALLETVSIIAYRQPVTRGEIEAIRGVNCDAILTALLNRDLILATGRRDTPGRPVEYGTTSDFLELFTMRDLSELPPLPDAESLANLLKHDAEQDAEAASGIESAVEGSEDNPAEESPAGEGSLPDGGLGSTADAGTTGNNGPAATDEAGTDDSEDSQSGDLPVKAMAAAAGAGVTDVETASDQAAESGQIDGTDGADSEDSQPRGSGFASSGRGSDS